MPIKIQQDDGVLIVDDMIQQKPHTIVGVELSMATLLSCRLMHDEKYKKILVAHRLPQKSGELADENVHQLPAG